MIVRTLIVIPLIVYTELVSMGFIEVPWIDGTLLVRNCVR